MSSIIRGLINSLIGHFVHSLPNKSYSFRFDETASKYRIKLKYGNEHMHCHKKVNEFDAFFTNSKSGNKIACLMIKPHYYCKYTILFSHGGTVDLGDMCNFLYTLALRLNCNIFIYDYSGFGLSQGSPTEKAVYADAETALQLVQEKYRVPIGNIVLYGQSLGTAATLHLATQNEVKAIILHSPFLSMGKIFYPKMQSGANKFYDYFKNVEMIKQVKAPILIIHGTSDHLVPISHAKELYRKCNRAFIPLWIEDGGHDDLYEFESYMKRLKRLFEHDLPKTF